MIDYVQLRLAHVRETLKTNGLKPILKELLYQNRIAVVVKKELREGLPIPLRRNVFEATCAEISLAAFKDGAHNQYRNRDLKAAYYLERGYRGFGLFAGKEIVADLWYYWPRQTPGEQGHKDLGWLGIQCPTNTVYAFDMFLNPKLRGQNLAPFFQGSFLIYLRDQGAKLAYGYYWLDNLPALWVHRTLKWDEVKRLKVTRCLFYRKAKVV
jgi:GNAT superfamily N-acetyltransferase